MNTDHPDASSHVPSPTPMEVGFALDAGERRIVAIEMPPLLTGEFKLLSYLGSRPGTWHTSYSLAVRVYQRNDAAARQLVWKYASTLRKKLATSLPELIELCRRRGYRCRTPLTVVGGECDMKVVL